MRKKMLAALGAAALVAGLSASSAMAEEPDPSEPATDPFVCPVMVLPEQAVDNSGKFNELPSGEYTFGPGNAGDPDTFNAEGKLPNRATNGDGSGTPPGDHSSPGDTDYTAIWAGN